MSSCSFIEKGDIEIKANTNDEKIISFVTVAKEITIAWGDGEIERYATDEITEKVFSHKYLSRNNKAITIKTQNLTCFELGEADKANIFINKCPDMKELICKGGKKLVSLTIIAAHNLEMIDCEGGLLESLDLSGCRKLKILQCGNNLLTSLNLLNNRALVSLSCQNNDFVPKSVKIDKDKQGINLDPAKESDIYDWLHPSNR